MSGLTGNNILAGSSGQATGYAIDQSLRFNDDDGTYLSKAAPGAAGNLNNWTLSVWLKRGQTTGLLSGSWEYQFFGQGDASSNPVSSMSFSDYSSDANKLVVSLYGTSDSNLVCKWSSDPLYRDHSAWYHVVIKWDNTQSAAADILKVYVNGQVVSGTFGTSPSNGTTTVVNKDFKQFLGKYVYNTQPNWWDGYMAEYHFIDGQSLTSASFGETNSDTNQWVPIKYEGTYGTQGWYLNFSDSSSLGADSSGNGNNFTANALTATDQVIDSPTNNFATLNPLGISDYNKWTFSEGNLKGTSSSDAFGEATFQLSSGKWYFEVDHTDAGGKNGLYVALVDPNDNYLAGSFDVRLIDGSGTGLYGVSIDMDAGSFATTLNGSASSSGSFTPQDCKIAFVNGTSANAKTFIANFGQDSSFAGARTAQGNGGVGEDFYYTPPTGYKALNTNNLPDPSIALPTDYFNTVLYTGNGSTQSINGVGFLPDTSWIKGRTNSYQHQIYDVVRGATKKLLPSTDIAETTDANALASFDSDGFSLGSNIGVNQNAINYVAWNWKAGGTAVSNTDGSITSSVSANPTAGFSIVSYTGNATSGATVGHGLSQAPEMLIVKQRDTVKNWSVLADSDPTDYLILNSANATADDSRFWNDTAPSSSVFTLGNINWVNNNNSTYIAYCFHSIEGYSKVGTYTGNGNVDGTFLYTGFMPQWLIVKQTNTTRDWIMYDNKRSEFNVMHDYLHPNLSNAEGSSGGVNVDFLSNGFKWRSANTAINVAGGKYIYLAFAESPIKYSNAR
jgi:hypothetical protein